LSGKTEEAATNAFDGGRKKKSGLLNNHKKREKMDPGYPLLGGEKS